MSCLLFQEDFAGNDNVDLYDDVISGTNDSAQTRQPVDRPPSANNQNSTPLVTNGSSTNSSSSNNSTTGRRYQLYIGNLTWVSEISIFICHLINFCFCFTIINL